MNPASFISVFTEPFVIGKIKYDFLKTYVYILLVHKMNHALVGHKITVFKEQKQNNMNFTLKLNSMNIYCKSMWLLLLLFRCKFRNARLHLGKGHSHIIFTTKFVPFISFNIYQPGKELLQRYVVTNSEYLKGFLSNKRIWYHWVTPKRLGIHFYPNNMEYDAQW